MNEQAIEAVADAIRAIDGPATLGGSDVAAGVLAFIRDAIHRDGDDADAIRETLGLRLNWNVRQQHYTPLGGGTGWKPVTERRVVGEWQETNDMEGGS